MEPDYVDSIPAVAVIFQWRQDRKMLMYHVIIGVLRGGVWQMLSPVVRRYSGDEGMLL